LAIAVLSVGVVIGLDIGDIYVALLGSVFCYLGSIMPDLDSESGRPIKEISAMVGSIAGVGAVIFVLDVTVDPVRITLAFFVGYLVTRFGLIYFISKVSKHRGMFHSVSAAIIYGLLIMAAYKATGFGTFWTLGTIGAIGYITHLSVDEHYSAGKKSAGTAFKLYSTRNKGLVVLVIVVKVCLVLYIADIVSL